MKIFRATGAYRGQRGKVVVSASKAQKIKGWDNLSKLTKKILQSWEKLPKCKGGVIVEHIETGSLMFCPVLNFDKP